MKLARLAAVLVSALPCTLAQAAGPAAPRPTGTTVLGTVCARLGTRVVIVAAQGAVLRPGQEFLVGRPALLVIVAKDKKPATVWGKWQEAGRIRVRFVYGTRACIAFVTTETPLTIPGGTPAPNIRPGDVVYRPSSIPPPKP